MTSGGKVLSIIYGLTSIALLALGLAGLLSRKIGFRIPIVSTDIIPALHRNAVWGETLRGRAILVGGEDWFFLILLGLILFLGILTAILCKVLQAASEK